jgi:hypothetical protein
MVNFNFYDIENLINESSSVLTSLFVTFSGTLLGFYGAFFISRQSEKKQKIKEMQNKNELYKGRLKYMTYLIDSCLDILNRQFDKIEELAKKVEEKPTEQHLLELFASNDLQRLQKMDSQEIFNAYYSIIPETDDKIKDYKNIYGSIDYLYLEMNQTIESIIRRNDFVHKDQLIVKDLVDSIAIKTKKLINDVKTNKMDIENPALFKLLILNDGTINMLIASEFDFGKVETDYLLPYAKALRNNFSSCESTKDIYDLLCQALRKFTHIKLNSDVFMKDLLMKRAKSSATMEKLSVINKKITKP